MTPYRLILSSVLLLFPAANTLGADGEILYRTRLCSTCHGQKPDEPVLPAYPKLAGQTSAYLLQQMKDIRDGKRTNGLSIAMRTAVGPVTDKELKILAEWLASQ